MKKYIIICVIIFYHTINAQQIVNINTYNIGDNSNKYFKDINGEFAPYLGTWEYQSGNQIFQVILWKVTKARNSADTNCYEDEIRGKFIMIENRGLPNEHIVYRSDKNYLGTNTPWIPVIDIYGGLLIDNCITPGPGEDPYVMVGLKFTIDTSTTPFTAHWQINDRRKNDLYIGEMPELSVPLDIVLTKIY